MPPTFAALSPTEQNLPVIDIFYRIRVSPARHSSFDAFHVLVFAFFALPGTHFFFFAVLAACLKALAVGAPFDPGFLIFSGVFPAAFWALIRFRFLWMFR